MGTSFFAYCCCVALFVRCFCCLLLAFVTFAVVHYILLLIFVDVPYCRLLLCFLSVPEVVFVVVWLFAADIAMHFLFILFCWWCLFVCLFQLFSILLLRFVVDSTICTRKYVVLFVIYFHERWKQNKWTTNKHIHTPTKTLQKQQPRGKKRTRTGIMQSQRQERKMAIDNEHESNTAKCNVQQQM